MNILRQKGQVIIYLVVFIGVLALAVSYVFNSTQVVNEKTRLQNTVDAAAYSVAVIESRSLNFTAYTNRAMIANHVAVAQAVSLTSWIRFLDISSENIADYTSMIPYVGSVTAAIEGIVGAIKEVMEPLLQAIASAIDFQITILQGSQQTMHAAMLAVAEETLSQVIAENDPDIDSSISLADAYLLGDFVRKHNNFVRRFDPDAVRSGSRGSRNYEQNRARMEEFRNITLDSRDGFTRVRNDDIPVIPRVDTFPVQWDVRRGGGTTMVGENSNAQYGSWIAMDTLSIHERSFRCNLRGCGWRRWREILPIGWGAAKNARGSEDIRFRNFRRSPDYSDSWRTNPTASNWAASDFQDESEVEARGSNYLGLRSFYDLALDGLITKGPGIKLVLSKPTEKIRTTSEIGVGTGNLDIEERGGMSGERVAAFAYASTYFARMNGVSGFQRASGIREYGNLYNPYWQAKLEKISDTDKLRLQAISQR
jgi:hypothetical protein